MGQRDVRVTTEYLPSLGVPRCYPYTDQHEWEGRRAGYKTGHYTSALAHEFEIIDANYYMAWVVVYASSFINGFTTLLIVL